MFRYFSKLFTYRVSTRVSKNLAIILVGGIGKKISCDEYRILFPTDVIYRIVKQLDVVCFLSVEPFRGTIELGRKDLDNGISCVDPMFVNGCPTPHSHLDNTGVPNPIDKLYSMQNSYFSVE